jgi:hypothetical protein
MVGFGIKHVLWGVVAFVAHLYTAVDIESSVPPFVALLLRQGNLSQCPYLTKAELVDRLVVYEVDSRHGVGQ